MRASRTQSRRPGGAGAGACGDGAPAVRTGAGGPATGRRTVRAHGRRPTHARATAPQRSGDRSASTSCSNRPRQPVPPGELEGGDGGVAAVSARAGTAARPHRGAGGPRGHVVRPAAAGARRTRVRRSRRRRRSSSVACRRPMRAMSNCPMRSPRWRVARKPGAGRPIANCGDGQLAQALEGYGAALLVDPDDAEARRGVIAVAPPRMRSAANTWPRISTSTKPKRNCSRRGRSCGESAAKCRRSPRPSSTSRAHAKRKRQVATRAPTQAQRNGASRNCWRKPQCTGAR